MTKEMKNKLDKVLDDVQDPESSLPLSALGIVEKYRYNEKLKELYVFTTFLSHRPACRTCVGISALLESSIKRDLKAALEKEFPELTVIYAE